MAVFQFVALSRAGSGLRSRSMGYFLATRRGSFIVVCLALSLCQVCDLTVLGATSVSRGGWSNNCESGQAWFSQSIGSSLSVWEVRHDQQEVFGAVPVHVLAVVALGELVVIVGENSSWSWGWVVPYDGRKTGCQVVADRGREGLAILFAGEGGIAGGLGGLFWLLRDIAAVELGVRVVV